MPWKKVVGIGVCIGIVILICVTIAQPHDGLTRVQREVAESLERAKLLREERDSVEYAEHERRFPDDDGEIVETSQDDAPKAKAIAAVNRSYVDDGLPLPVIEASDQSRASGAVQRASVPSNRFFTTDKMDGFRPKGKKRRFKVGDPVYVYAGINAPQSEQVRIEWVDASGRRAAEPHLINITTNTGSNGYRVYKYRQFKREGKYEARLYNEAGALIGSTDFKVLSRSIMH